MRADLLLYGPVAAEDAEGSISAARVARQLDTAKRSGASGVDMFLNTEGGSVVEGLAIYNQIRRSSLDVVVHVDGIAASIGSLIAIAGSRLVMPASAMLMIHSPWMPWGVVGNSTELLAKIDDLRKVSSDLRKMERVMLAAYVTKTKLPPSKVEGLMAAETWLTAEEARSLGFCDEVLTKGTAGTGRALPRVVEMRARTHAVSAQIDRLAKLLAQNSQRKPAVH